MSRFFTKLVIGAALLGASAATAYAQQSLQFAPDYASVKTMPNPNNDAEFSKAVTAYENQQFDTALSLARNLATTGHAEAQVMAGYILMGGKTGIINDTEAASWLSKAAAQNNVDAYVGLGEMALKSRAGLTPKDALPWFSKAAQVGRPDAMRAIGEMYTKGIGIDQDAEKGRVWLSKAADFGDSRADRKMADSLFESDPSQALSYYEKAAAKGDNEAAYIAAVMYEENLEIKPNAPKMVALMQQAASAGIAPAQADYGLLVYQGRGVSQSKPDAAKWFERSANGGDPEGQFLYAFTLAKGEGAPQDLEGAYYWLLKSGKSGVSDYDLDRKKLREALEAQAPADGIARAKARFEAEGR